MKQKIYIETSVVSYFTNRPSRDLVTAARQQVTREWWEESSQHFDLFISVPVLEEAGPKSLRTMVMNARYYAPQRSYRRKEKMKEDAIVEEVRQYRDAHAKKFNYDLKKICEDLKKKEKNYGNRIVSLPAKYNSKKTG